MRTCPGRLHPRAICSNPRLISPIRSGVKTGMCRPSGPPAKVSDGHLVHINTQIMIERGEAFAEGDWPRNRFAAEPVGRTDDLAGLDSAAGEHGAGNPRPMIAPGILVDSRRAAKLAPH